MALTTSTSSNADFDVDVDNDNDVFYELTCEELINSEELSTLVKDLISSYQSKTKNFKILQKQHKNSLEKAKGLDIEIENLRMHNQILK